MNRGQTVETNHAIEFAKRFLDLDFAADVVAGRENVRGIKTNAETFRFAHMVNDVGEVLEPMAEA